MRKILSCILVMMLLASAVLMAVTPAAAYEEKIPFAGEDNELTKDELSSAICSYMLDEGGLSDDVGDAAYVYAYWEGKPKTIVDMTDRTVTLYRPPERVAPLSNTFIEEVMCVFGVEDRSVAVSACCCRDNSSYDYTYKGEHYTFTGASYPSDVLYPKFLELPYVGRLDSGINYETLATAKPELVIIRMTCCASEENVKRAAKVIESMGIPVVVIKDPSNYEDQREDIIYKEIAVLGEVFDKQREAQQSIDRMDEVVETIKERTKDIPEDEKPTVLYFGLSRKAREEGGVGNVQSIDALESEFLENIVNAKNAFRGMGRQIMSSEQVLALNPDVIILPTSHGHHPPTELYESEHFKNIQEVKAIKEKRVCSLPATSCRSERLEFPIELMIEAKCCYPERFADIDISEWSSDYYKEIYGIEDDKVEEIKLAQQYYRLEIE